MYVCLCLVVQPSDVFPMLTHTHTDVSTRRPGAATTCILKTGAVVATVPINQMEKKQKRGSLLLLLA